MMKTPEGKWILFAVETGEQAEFWPIDAKRLIALGSHTLEPPTGIVPVVPAQPPRHAAPPQTASVQTFVDEDGTAPTPKRGRKVEE